MGQFDQTARPIAKLDGAAFLRWVLLCVKRGPRLTFLGWDDTRRLVAPGEPDRINDLVASVRDEARPERLARLVVEMEDEAEAGILWRMAHYEAHLGKEVNHPCDPEGAIVCSAVVNLSGVQKVRAVKPPFHAYGTGIAPMIVDVSSQDAKKTLRLIERGEVGLTILPFCALMKGAGMAAYIERWKRAVEKETDTGRRVLFKDWALILAELAGWQADWHKATEGWMDRKSTLIEGWLKEGREEGGLRTKREYLLLAIQRLQDPVPDSIRRAVEGTNDPAKLDEWYAAALRSRTLAALRRAMSLDAGVAGT